VILTCTTNAADCGEIHSIKWYRGMDRVYVYSPFTNFRNAEGILVDRSNVVDSESSSDLQVDQLQATDDGDYRCEITYLDVSTACPTVYNHKLITTALPEAVKLSVGEEELVSVQQPELGIETGVAGPFQLGEEVEFVCEAVQFKPEAEISWKLGEEQLDGASEQMEDLDDGTRSLKSSLKLSVDRQHLGVSVICSVSFEEENVADLSVELDLEVPPDTVELSLPDLEEGEDGEVVCVSRGGRPSPYVSFAGLEHVDGNQEVEGELESDLTHTITTRFTFTASSEYDAATISCVVEHPALTEPLQDSKELVVKYAPVVLLVWDNRPLAEGDRVELACPYTANPADGLSVTWMYNSEEIQASENYLLETNDEEEDVLVIESMDRSSLGQYSCTVENELGSSESNPVQIDATFSPEELILEAGQLTADEEAALRCTATKAKPAVVPTWEGIEMLEAEETIEQVEESDSTISVTSLLVFTPSKDHLDLSVRCVAEHPNLDEPMEDSTLLDVHYPPEASLEWENKTIIEGETVELRCTHSSNPSNGTILTWLYNSEEILESETVHFALNEEEEEVLVLEQVDQYTAGRYACRVENPLGVSLSNSVEIDVLLPPSGLVVMVEELTAGEETVLECRAPGARPQALPGWVGVDQLDSTQETEDVEEEDGTFSVISRLSFTPTYMENNLEISCVVDHPALDEPLEETRTLDVKHPPRVSLEWENVTVVEGDTVELRCAYFSNPSNGTLITWYYEGEVLEEVESVLEEVEGEDNLVDLLYLQVNRTSTGEYSCSAANQLGTGESLPVYLDVLYGPSVELSMDPEDALVEGDEDNVTLTCSLVDGNPEDLLDVLWFQDSFPLEVDSLECDERSCMIQLQGERSEAGNYSCVGINSAGPGPESDGQLVQVQYTSSAGLVEADKFDPVKGGNTSFSCVLEDLGFPSVESYVWKKDGAVLDWAEDSVVVLEELRAEHSGNISCSGINSAGTNFGEVYFLDVFAPPAFITELPRQVEMTEDFQWVNLTCQVECAPLCNIEWLRNMQKIIGSESLEAMTASVEDEANLFKDYEVMVSAVEEDSDYEEAAEDDLELMVGEEMITEDADSPFLISMEYVPPDFSNNQFSSVVSRLSIQLGNVSQELLDSFQFSNFTCFVASGELGEEISSTTMLAIHHEPLDMELSVEDVNLVEAEELEPVHCSASAVPEPQIVWMKDGETVSNSEVLQFENPISREDAGEYTCEASNYQGSTSRSFSLQVEYAPSCYVTKERNEDLVILKCVAEGNPQDYLFWWRHENLSFEGQVEGDTSVLSLRNVNDSMVYEYSCFVNNSIGQSEPCSVQEQEGFLYLASTEPWLLVIIILGILLAIIIVSLIIWHLCCRNKPEKGGPGSSGKSRPADNQPHPDNSFYDNLPFHGLRSPPKQVLNAVDDNMVYADVDAQETYSYGPLAYKTTSLQRAAKLKKLEESKL